MGSRLSSSNKKGQDVRITPQHEPATGQDGTPGQRSTQEQRQSRQPDINHSRDQLPSVTFNRQIHVQPTDVTSVETRTHDRPTQSNDIPEPDTRRYDSGSVTAPIGGPRGVTGTNPIDRSYGPTALPDGPREHVDPTGRRVENTDFVDGYQRDHTESGQGHVTTPDGTRIQQTLRMTEGLNPNLAEGGIERQTHRHSKTTAFGESASAFYSNGDYDWPVGVEKKKSPTQRELNTGDDMVTLQRNSESMFQTENAQGLTEGAVHPDPGTKAPTKRKKKKKSKKAVPAVADKNTVIVPEAPEPTTPRTVDSRGEQSQPTNQMFSGPVESRGYPMQPTNQMFSGPVESRGYPMQSTDQQRKLEEAEETLQWTFEELEKERQKTRYLEIQLSETRKKKADLELRLSASASAQLTEGNPNIADLSDVNRPAKLAERFAEVYDTQWTDAFEYLTDVIGENDNDAIRKLLNVLLDIYEVCAREAQTQLETIQQQMKDFTGASTMDNLKEAMVVLKRRRKIDFMEHIQQLKKQVRPTIRKTFPSGWSEPLMKYLRLCVELSWLMCLQDPVVTLLVPDRGDLFDSATMRTYTQSGNSVDFCVWPVLCLYKGGPLLSKGIVQGLNGDSVAKQRTNAPSELVSGGGTGRPGTVDGGSDEVQDGGRVSGMRNGGREHFNRDQSDNAVNVSLRENGMRDSVAARRDDDVDQRTSGEEEPEGRVKYSDDIAKVHGTKSKDSFLYPERHTPQDPDPKPLAKPRKKQHH